jgi:hypothetical protein
MPDCSPAAALLEPLKDALQSSAGADLQIIVRSKDQQQQQMGALLDSIRAVDGARVGTLLKEQHSGQLAELWAQQLGDSGLATCDATAGAARHCVVYGVYILSRLIADMAEGAPRGSSWGTVG